jgi:hypothetical protein
MCYCWRCSAGIDGKAEEFADVSQTLGSGIEGIDEGEGLGGREGEGGGGGGDRCRGHSSGHTGGNEG